MSLVLVKSNVIEDVMDRVYNTVEKFPRSRIVDRMIEIEESPARSTQRRSQENSRFWKEIFGIFYESPRFHRLTSLTFWHEIVKSCGIEERKPGKVVKIQVQDADLLFAKRIALAEEFEDFVSFCLTHKEFAKIRKFGMETDTVLPMMTHPHRVYIHAGWIHRIVF